MIDQLNNSCILKGTNFDKVYNNGTKWDETHCRSCLCLVGDLTFNLKSILRPPESSNWTELTVSSFI